MKRVRVGDDAAVDDRSLVGLSKRMSLALRHKPERFGLVLDAGGWVRVDNVLAALRLTRAELERRRSYGQWNGPADPAGAVTPPT
jgi:putative RNA 2'-phosphotransferase